MRRLALLTVVLSAVTLARPALAEDTASFRALKALSGTWTGVAHAPGKHGGQPTRATFRVVSAGSAVMLMTDPGTKHEMVTLFHEDDGALMATHYCAGQNQPRFKAEAGEDGKRLVFEFMDGTNLGAHPGRMQRLVISLPGRDRQVQEWTYRDGDQESTMAFELERKRAGG
jgi:hypothetical protein